MRLDVFELSGRNMSEEGILEWCEARVNECVLPLHREFDWDADAPDYVELTGRDLLLHAFRFEYINPAFNLLGDNLVAPAQRAPEFRIYGASEEEIALEQRVFGIFREVIEQSELGWAEVVPFPGSDNIIFLKGANGAFDWVLRDQRDGAFVGNPYHPILMSQELPSAMNVSALNAHLYFKTGEWYERLEHSAETRHYAEGGTPQTWPGYAQLLMRELTSSRRNYSRPSQPRGWRAANFVPHQLDGYCLMVSPLVTVKEFWSFFDGSDWQKNRVTRSGHDLSKLEPDLAAVNLHDEDNVPASVTWFDAVAFCRYYEEKTGLPVRLPSSTNQGRPVRSRGPPRWRWAYT